MFEAIFGTEMPLAFRFFIAFVIVLGLIGAAAFLVRRFGTGALNAAGMTRGRQPRLAVTEFAAVDARRRLVLIRRDNVEHLVLIGGPSDVVIEPNIVRASPASSARDAQPLRAATSISDVMPRATPLDDGPAWPPQIEPTPRPQRAGVPPPAAAIAAEDDDPDWSEVPEPAPPAISDSMLRAIPDAPLRVLPEPALRAVETTPRPSLDSAPRANNGERFSGLAADLSRNFLDPNDAPAPPRRAAESRRPPAPVQPLSESEEQNLAEMAQRLETALQRPRPGPEPALAPAVAALVARGGETARAEPEQRAEPAPRAETKSAPRPEPGPAPRAETKPAPRPEPNPAPRAETKSAPRLEPSPAPRSETKATPRLEPAAAPRAETKPTPRPDIKPAAKTAFDNLEQEMASLLGRPSGKT